MRKELYAAVAVLSLTPLWSVQYIPTIDGPSHVYNAWVLRDLIGGGGGVIAQWFSIDWRPHPNWMASAVIALLMTIVPALIAEKLFVSAIVLLFFLGIW